MISRIGTYWRNAEELPFLLRLLCKGGMVAGPILFVFLVVPIMDWTVNGHQMSYSDLWRSGAGMSALLLICLVTFGTWGMAARLGWSRWALVLAPVLSIILFPKSLVPNLGFALINGLVTAVIIYGCLFHLKPVQVYFSKSDNA